MYGGWAWKKKKKTHRKTRLDIDRLLQIVGQNWDILKIQPA